MTKQQQSALQKGREKAARRKRKESIERVIAYKKWIEADATYSRKSRKLADAGTPFRQVKKQLGGRPRMPAIPSDYDFTVAREEGKIT